MPSRTSRHTDTAKIPTKRRTNRFVPVSSFWQGIDDDQRCQRPNCEHKAIDHLFTVTPNGSIKSLECKGSWDCKCVGWIDSSSVYVR